jgi:CopG family transcriptional regulator, nickel-responsive regulator
MERITISIDEELARAFDALIARKGYSNRSEAMRDLLRSHLESAQSVTAEAGHCVANLSYVYNHHERDLAERLTGFHHDHHDLTVATMHVHLDHENCLESVILKGSAVAVRAFADAVTAERGVRHGQVNIVSVDVDHGRHNHGYAPRGKAASHPHLKPRS